MRLQKSPPRSPRVDKRLQRLPLSCLLATGGGVPLPRRRRVFSEHPHAARVTAMAQVPFKTSGDGRFRTIAHDQAGMPVELAFMPDGSIVERRTMAEAWL